MFCSKIEDKTTARNEIIKGMAVYQKEKKRIEFLHISRSLEDTISILDYFEKLLPQLLYKKRFGSIDFYGSVVSNQHMHILIRKPFIPWDNLRSYWQSITGKNSNIEISTLKYDMEGIYKYDRAMSYLLNQDEQHIDHKGVFYVRSPSWGVVLHKKREYKKKSGKDINPDWRKKTFSTSDPTDQEIKAWDDFRKSLDVDYEKIKDHII